MSVNMNSGAAAIGTKHRGNAEGGVRVLGQTAAVAGISGALLLALKALVLVSPAVLPHGAGLDALGHPNAVSAPEAPAASVAPVTFEPAAADLPIGSSERTAPTNFHTVTIPSTITKTVTTKVPGTTSNTPPTSTTPGNPPSSTPSGPGSTVGTITKPVTDTLDGLLGTKLGKTVDDLGKTVNNTVDTVNGATGSVLKPVTDTVGLGSDSAAKGGLVPTVGKTVGSTVGSVTGTVTGTVSGATGSGSGGLLSSVTGNGGLLGGVLGH